MNTEKYESAKIILRSTVVVDSSLAEAARPSSCPALEIRLGICRSDHCLGHGSHHCPGTFPKCAVPRNSSAGKAFHEKRNCATGAQLLPVLPVARPVVVIGGLDRL